MILPVEPLSDALGVADERREHQEPDVGVLSVNYGQQQLDLQGSRIFASNSMSLIHDDHGELPKVRMQFISPDEQVQLLGGAHQDVYWGPIHCNIYRIERTHFGSIKLKRRRKPLDTLPKWGEILSKAVRHLVYQCPSRSDIRHPSAFSSQVVQGLQNPKLSEQCLAARRWKINYDGPMHSSR